MVDSALAISEWLDLAVAAGTISLAVATAGMASATIKMAMAAEQQLDLLRRQTAASEAIVAHEKQKELAQGLPVLRALRSQGDQVAVGMSDAGWSIALENKGHVPAVNVHGELRLPGGNRASLEATSGSVDPDGQVILRSSLANSRGPMDEAIKAPSVIHVAVTYESPSGSARTTRFAIRPKGHGDRWLAVRRERHTPP